MYHPFYFTDDVKGGYQTVSLSFSSITSVCMQVWVCQVSFVVVVPNLGSWSIFKYMQVWLDHVAYMRVTLGLGLYCYSFTNVVFYYAFI